MFRIILLAFVLAFANVHGTEEILAHQYSQEEQELTVAENLHGGKVLVLSDGSTWEVASQSLKVSETWIFPSPLKVEKSENPSYPYRITNLQTGTSILVRPIAPQSSVKSDFIES